jgi:hypothetical protein
MKPSKTEEEVEEPKQRKNSKSSDKGEEVEAEDVTTLGDMKDAVKLDIGAEDDTKGQDSKAHYKFKPMFRILFPDRLQGLTSK